MFAALVVGSLGTLNLPHGCVIDCSTWTGAKTTRLKVRIETCDGTVIRGQFELPDGTDPGSPRIGFRLLFNDNSWRYEKIGEYRFFVRGSKTSAIRKVEFESDGWMPICFFVRTPPPYTAPPPREAKGPDPHYVEFDFSPLPQNGEGKCAYTITVLTADKDLKYSTEAKGPKKFQPDGQCEAWAINMRVNGWKVEVVDKTKLRVYGRIFNDELIPATKGSVESPDLKKEELPKVKNPGKDA